MSPPPFVPPPPRPGRRGSSAQLVGSIARAVGDDVNTASFESCVVLTRLVIVNTEGAE
jgi:hypothetical protein